MLQVNFEYRHDFIAFYPVTFIIAAILTRQAGAISLMLSLSQGILRPDLCFPAFVGDIYNGSATVEDNRVLVNH